MRLHSLLKLSSLFVYLLAGPPDDSSLESLILRPLSEEQLNKVAGVSDAFESANVALSSYLRRNPSNDVDKIEGRNDYSTAAALLSILTKEEVASISDSKRGIATYAKAMEEIVALYETSRLDDLVAEILAFSTNFGALWNHFSNVYQEKYGRSSIICLTRAGSHTDVKKLLITLKFDRDCDFLLTLLSPACFSGSNSTIRLIEKLAIKCCEKKKMQDLKIENALMADNLELFKPTLDKTHDLKQREHFLSDAIKVGSLGIVKELLKSILSTNPDYSFHISILGQTVYNSNYKVFGYLITITKANKERVQSLFKNGYYLQSAFVKACALGNLDFMSFLLSQNSNGKPLFPEITSFYNMEASTQAVYNGHLKVIEYLLELWREKDDDAELDRRVSKLVEKATSYKQFAISDFLISYITRFVKNSSVPHCLPHDSMVAACKKGDSDIIDYCLSTFSDAKTVVEEKGQIYLAYALKAGHFKFARQFLTRFPEVNLGYDDKLRFSLLKEAGDNLLLHLAVKMGNVKLARVILRKNGLAYAYRGVDPGYESNRAIRTAVSKGDIDMIKELLRHSLGDRVHPSVSLLERCKKSKLHALDIAVLQGKDKILRILLEKINGKYIHLPADFKFDSLVPGASWKSAYKLVKVNKGLEQHQYMSFLQVFYPDSPRINILRMEPFTSVKTVCSDLVKWFSSHPDAQGAIVFSFFLVFFIFLIWFSSPLK